MTTSCFLQPHRMANFSGICREPRKWFQAGFAWVWGERIEDVGMRLFFSSFVRRRPWSCCSASPFNPAVTRARSCASRTVAPWHYPRPRPANGTEFPGNGLQGQEPTGARGSAMAGAFALECWPRSAWPLEGPPLRTTGLWHLGSAMLHACNNYRQSDVALNSGRLVRLQRLTFGPENLGGHS
jgi:hypothetical protein